MPAIIALFVIIILINLGGGLAQGKSTSSNEIKGSTTSEQTVKATRSTKLKEVEVEDFRTPTIETLSAQDIESRKANLRGKVNMYSHKNGLVFAVYGYNAKDVSGYTNKYNTYSEIPTSENDRARSVLIASKAKTGLNDYRRSVSNLVANTNYYYKICIEHDGYLNTRQITCGSTKTFNTNPSSFSSNAFTKPRLSLSSATYIEDTEATLSGSVSMNSGIDGIVFFVYGEKQSLIKSVEELDRYSEVKEADENLQKIRVGAGVRGNANYSQIVKDLEKDTTYYYRICAEYDGEDSGMTCTSVRNFTTDGRDKSSLPFVKTNTASFISNEVKLSGVVEMNDFFDGIAFFVFGTDESKINNVSTLTSFSGVKQNGDKIQKILVDSDADGKNTYTKNLADLNSGEHYFYRICVEYKNEDAKGRLVSFLQCGSTGHFLAK